MGLAPVLKWKIRRALDSDYQAILALHKALNRPPRADFRTSEYFVASTGETVVGCAAVRIDGTVGYLYGLAVAKAWRRQGMGHALTKERLDWLREKAADSAYVLAMFWNVRFFKKHGFELADRDRLGELARIHDDFSKAWSARSALLRYTFQKNTRTTAANREDHGIL